jgi:hypothetical protein
MIGHQQQRRLRLVPSGAGVMAQAQTRSNNNANANAAPPPPPPTPPLLASHQPHHHHHRPGTLARAYFIAAPAASTTTTTPAAAAAPPQPPPPIHPSALADLIRREGASWRGAAYLLDAHGSQMNALHVSSLLARLAAAEVANGRRRRGTTEEEEPEGTTASPAQRWTLLRRLLRESAARLPGSGPRQLSASLWALARLLRAQEARAGDGSQAGDDDDYDALAPSPSSSSSRASSPRPLAPSWYLSAWAEAWRANGQARARGRDAAEALAALAALRVPLCAMAAEAELRRRGGPAAVAEPLPPQPPPRLPSRRPLSPSAPSTPMLFTAEQARRLARDLPSALHRAAASTGATAAAGDDDGNNTSPPTDLSPRDAAVGLSAMADLSLIPSAELLAALCFAAQRWEPVAEAPAEGQQQQRRRQGGLAAFSPAEAAAVLSAFARLRTAPPDRSWIPELLARQASNAALAAEVAAAVPASEHRPSAPSPAAPLPPPSPRDWSQSLSALARLRALRPPPGGDPSFAASPLIPFPPSSWLSRCLDELGAAARAHARRLLRRRERAAVRGVPVAATAPPPPPPLLSRELACAGAALASLRVRPLDAWLRSYEAAAVEEAELLLSLPAASSATAGRQRQLLPPLLHLSAMASAMVQLRHRPSPRFITLLMRVTGPSLDLLPLRALAALGGAVAAACRGGEADRQSRRRPHHPHPRPHHTFRSAAAGFPRRRRELRSWLRRWQRAVLLQAAAAGAAVGAAPPRLGARLLWAADEMTRHSGAIEVLQEMDAVTGVTGMTTEEDAWTAEDEEDELSPPPRHRHHRRNSRSPSPAALAAAGSRSYPSARWAASVCRATGLLPPIVEAIMQQHQDQQPPDFHLLVATAALSPPETARLAAAVAGLALGGGGGGPSPTPAAWYSASSDDDLARERSSASARDLVPLLDACLLSLARTAVAASAAGPAFATRAQLARCARAVAALPTAARPPAATLEAFCAAVAASSVVVVGVDDDDEDEGVALALALRRRDALRRALGALLGCGVGGSGPDGGSGRAVYDARTGACAIIVDDDGWRG